MAKLITTPLRTVERKDGKFGVHYIKAYRPFGGFTIRNAGCILETIRKDNLSVSELVQLGDLHRVSSDTLIFLNKLSPEQRRGARIISDKTAREIDTALAEKIADTGELDRDWFCRYGSVWTRRLFAFIDKLKPEYQNGVSDPYNAWDGWRGEINFDFWLFIIKKSIQIGRLENIAFFSDEYDIESLYGDTYGRTNGNAVGARFKPKNINSIEFIPYFPNNTFMHRVNGRADDFSIFGTNTELIFFILNLKRVMLVARGVGREKHIIIDGDRSIDRQLLMEIPIIEKQITRLHPPLPKAVNDQKLPDRSQQRLQSLTKFFTDQKKRTAAILGLVTHEEDEIDQITAFALECPEALVNAAGGTDELREEIRMNLYMHGYGNGPVMGFAELLEKVCSHFDIRLTGFSSQEL